jgi:hypothetical protein
MKANLIATVEALHLKPTSLSRMPIPLCRLFAMPIVRPTLSSDVALLEKDFVYGFQEGAAMFYLFTTNEAGLIDKVLDENLQSCSPLWYSSNDRFKDYLSSIALKHLKGVKFSICDGVHQRQAWWNVISRLHSTDLSWYYIVDSIVLETQHKPGVVKLMIHDIDKYIFYIQILSTNCHVKNSTFPAKVLI